jgi:hypothetical protein
MTISIPKWVMIRYAVLYKEFKCSKIFNRGEAKKAFEKHKIKSDEKMTNTFFSELNKKGWVIVNKNKDDSRKKAFRLVSPEKAIQNLELKD